jgi:hypothetical protein
MKFRTFRALLAAGALVGAGGGIWLLASPASSPQEPEGSAPVPESPPLPGPLPTRALPGSPAPDVSAPAGEHALRPLDREILARLAAPLPSGKVKDAFAGRPYKVSLFQEAGHTLPNRLKIDLDRDEHWDEKWTLDRSGSGLKVKRQVAPADDEQYEDEYRLEGDRWRRK